MKKFRNINYNYATPDDSFIARGLQLNEIVDEINNIYRGVSPEAIAASGGTMIIQLAKSEDLEQAIIDYKYTVPGASEIGGNADQTGQLRINNSMESPNQSLSHIRESENHGSGSEDQVVFDVTHDGKYINLEITNNLGNPIEFNYTLKIMKYVTG
jgi:hypothetical protein